MGCPWIGFKVQGGFIRVRGFGPWLGDSGEANGQQTGK